MAVRVAAMTRAFRRRTSACLALVAVVAVGTVSLAGPAAAGCIPVEGSADGRIRRAGETQYVGNGVLNAFGDGQSKKTTVLGSGVAFFELRWKNKDTVERTIVVDQPNFLGNPPEGFKARYYVNGVDVSSQVKGLGLELDVEAGRSTPVITVRLKSTSAATPGDLGRVFVDGVYEGGPCPDTPAAKLKLAPISVAP
jgi:hypothetical protein